MPIYEFSCQNCNAEFEIVLSFSDSTMPVCPKCASSNVQRLLSRPAIHFKGSGWYINDSKNNTKTSAVGTTGVAEGDGAKSTESKTEEPKTPETKEKSEKSEKVEKVEKAAEPAPVSKTESPAT